jgi:hypothetical protein
MPHELASTFTSKVFDKVRQVYVEDPLDNFDLRNINAATGNIAGCYRFRSGAPTKPITGGATQVLNGNQNLAYHVEIDQTDPVEAHYRGIALRNIGGEVTTIIGVKRTPRVGRLAEGARAAVQDETTWVVTKP